MGQFFKLGTSTSRVVSLCCLKSTISLAKVPITFVLKASPHQNQKIILKLVLSFPGKREREREKGRESESNNLRFYL